MVPAGLLAQASWCLRGAEEWEAGGVGSVGGLGWPPSPPVPRRLPATPAQDMSSLMHTIYEVVDASVHRCSGSSKTLRVKLTVSPEPSSKRKDGPPAAQGEGPGSWSLPPRPTLPLPRGPTHRAGSGGVNYDLRSTSASWQRAPWHPEHRERGAGWGQFREGLGVQERVRRERVRARLKVHE